MSRMITLALASLLLAGLVQATDIEKHQPGAKPFHTPRSPQPVGVLTNCFGYHPTSWTQWNIACTESTANCAPAVVSQPSNKAIILYDRAPEAKAPMPSKEQSLPIPPGK